METPMEIRDQAIVEEKRLAFHEGFVARCDDKPSTPPRTLYGEEPDAAYWWRQGWKTADEIK